MSGITFVDTTDFYNFRWQNNADFNDLVDNYSHGNAIDIFIVPDENFFSGAQANYIPGNAIVITKDVVNDGSTLAHEIGHCLGLYHTHQKTADGAIFGGWTCDENINGSNCATCGDLVCDTPADPNLDINSDGNCNYTGPIGYTPLINNIMSYSKPYCRSVITAGQGARILEVIPNSSGLPQRLIDANVSITNQNVPATIIPCGTCPVITISQINFIAKNTITSSGNVVVSSGGQLGYLAESEINILPGFEAVQGSIFSAVIDETCPAVINFKVTNSNNSNNESVISSNLGQIQKKNQADIYFLVLPNPNNGEFKLALNTNNELPKSIIIRDYQGKEVKTINNPTEYELNIDLKNLNNGLFIITANYADVIMSKRIIKQ